MINMTIKSYCLYKNRNAMAIINAGFGAYPQSLKLLIKSAKSFNLALE